MELDFEKFKALISSHLLESKEEETAEEAFIKLIAERVEFLMESNMELFINHLYRMDVDEKRINNTLLLAEDSDETVYLAIARLIYERQKERIQTRGKFKQDHTDFWAEE
jgi:hypothetical protein